MSPLARRSSIARRAAACRAPLLLVVGVLGAAACSGPIDPIASTAVVTDTLVAWAINGTGGTEPSGFYLAENRVVNVTSALTFDFAFDVDSTTGQAIIIPVRFIEDGSIAAFTVGFQRLTQTPCVVQSSGPCPFNEIPYALKANVPNSGYQTDSVYRLSPGQGLMMESNPPGCATDPLPFLYGKFVIDSVNKALRTIHFRATEDPNCGYREFNDDSVPTF
jgi:hypothetical protein